MKFDKALIIVLVSSIIIFFIWRILEIIPFYNYWYRFFHSLSILPMLFYYFIVGVTVVFCFIISRSFKRGLLVVIFVVSYFILISPVYDQLRRSITQYVVDEVYCDNDKTTNEVILGGVKKDINGYYNDSSCLFANCEDEVYYCN